MLCGGPEGAAAVDPEFPEFLAPSGIQRARPVERFGDGKVPRADREAASAACAEVGKIQRPLPVQRGVLPDGVGEQFLLGLGTHLFPADEVVYRTGIETCAALRAASFRCHR